MTIILDHTANDGDRLTVRHDPYFVPDDLHVVVTDRQGYETLAVRLPFDTLYQALATFAPTLRAERVAAILDTDTVPAGGSFPAHRISDQPTAAEACEALTRMVGAFKPDDDGPDPASIDGGYFTGPHQVTVDPATGQTFLDGQPIGAPPAAGLFVPGQHVTWRGRLMIVTDEYDDGTYGIVAAHDVTDGHIVAGSYLDPIDPNDDLLKGDD